MGCGASKAVQTTDSQKKSDKPVLKSITFEVPVNQVEDGDSDSKKSDQSDNHKRTLPKRLQRLEEQASQPITAKEIEEKQKLAEKRRKSILDEKIQKSKQLQSKSEGKKSENESQVSIETNAENTNEENKDEIKKETSDTNKEVNENDPKLNVLVIRD